MGHCGENRMMFSCNHCGPIISSHKHTKAGDYLPCPNCHGQFVVKDHEGSLVTEYSGVMIDDYTTKVDYEMIDQALSNLPEYIEL